MINKVKTIGITGSKGKTSVCILLKQYLDRTGKKSLLYCSLDYEVAVKTNERLKEIKEEANDKDIDFLIIEINEEYINNIDKKEFDIKVLTNLSIITEKCDYEEYKNKTLSFFDKDSESIICYSPEIEKDEYLNFINKINNKYLFGSHYEITKYGIDENLFFSLIFNNNKRIDSINGINFFIKRKDKLLKIESNMLFDYSAYNINCLYAIINKLNIYNESKFIGLVNKVTIQGRCEVISINNRKIIITMTIIPILEDLYYYKEMKEIGDIILVISSIGVGHKTWDSEYNSKEQIEKLKKARKYACQYAKEYANTIYLTSSDPASSNPLDISNEMEKYLNDEEFYNTVIEVDRYYAIKNSIMNSKERDCIVISGRGSRDKYIIKDKEYLFSDKSLVDKAIKEIGWI